MRADQLLVERGLAASRSQAARLIAAGLRWREPHGEWRHVLKNRDEVPAQAEVELLDAAEARYVSRGGLKLEGALDALQLSVDGQVCLDVGQSTGGFTDCLLQRGASHVVGLDVGQAQLHERLRQDARVTAIEKVNARHLTAEDLSAWPHEPRFDLAVGDLSFISSTLVLPAVVPFLREGGRLLLLVKPQFELQPGQVGKGGIVREAALFEVVEKRLRDCCTSLGLQVSDWLDSPITGGDGNREFFIHAVRRDGEQGAGRAPTAQF